MRPVKILSENHRETIEIQCAVDDLPSVKLMDIAFAFLTTTLLDTTFLTPLLLPLLSLFIMGRAKRVTNRKPSGTGTRKSAKQPQISSDDEDENINPTPYATPVKRPYPKPRPLGRPNADAEGQDGTQEDASAAEALLSLRAPNCKEQLKERVFDMSDDTITMNSDGEGEFDEDQEVDEVNSSGMSEILYCPRGPG